MSTGKSFLYSFLDRYSSLIIMIVSSMVISRLLSPEEIGVYSVSLGLIAIVTAFRDFGAGNYLVTCSKIDDDTISSVWTVMLLFGALFTLVVVVIGYFSGYFYNEPEIREIIYVSALSFILTPFSSIKYALMMRDSQYKVLSFVRFMGNFMSAFFSILLAYYDYGAASLAYGNIASILIVNLMFHFFGRKVDYLTFSIRNSRKIFKFGGVYTFVKTYKSFVAILPEILIGKFYSFHHAGIFSRGMGLSYMFHRLIVDATHPVVLSSFSNAARDRTDVGSMFVYYNSLISAVGWALLAFIAYNAELLIRILYGDQWGEAVIFCQLACLWVSLSILTMNIDLMFLAQQQMKNYLAINFFSSTAKLIAILVGVFYGPEEIIIAMCAISLLSSPVTLYFARNKLKFDLSKLTLNYCISLFIALVVVGSNMLLNHCFVFQNYIISTFFHSLVSLLVFAASAFILSPFIRSEIIKLYLNLNLNAKIKV